MPQNWYGRNVPSGWRGKTIGWVTSWAKRSVEPSPRGTIISSGRGAFSITEPPALEGHEEVDVVRAALDVGQLGDRLQAGQVDAVGGIRGHDGGRQRVVLVPLEIGVVDLPDDRPGGGEAPLTRLPAEAADVGERGTDLTLRHLLVQAR